MYFQTAFSDAQDVKTLKNGTQIFIYKNPAKEITIFYESWAKNYSISVKRLGGKTYKINFPQGLTSTYGPEEFRQKLETALNDQIVRELEGTLRRSGK